MNLNLDTLKKEILEQLEDEGFAVFHGYSRLATTDSFVAWDSERRPDFREFLRVAKQAGVKLMVYHHREFTEGHIEDAEDRLEGSAVTVDEQRNLERRLRELKGYEGFTCAIELSFEHDRRVYVYHLRSEWYEDYLDLVEEIDAATPDEDEEEEDDGSMGGYYSRN